MFKMVEVIKDKIKSHLPKRQFKVSYEKQFSDPTGRLRIELVPLDKDDDLNHVMVDKFIESILHLVQNANNAQVNLEIEFKQSILTCKVIDGIIALRTIWPKDSRNFDEVAHFSNKPFPLKEYLYDNVRSNEDIVELEKTMIRLL